jgi:hypothetical protein
VKGKHMRCDRHGRIAWELTIVCGGCGRFYQIVPDKMPFKPLCEGSVQAPERCECGKRLAPEASVPGGGIFWARSVCSDCFRDKCAAAVARERFVGQAVELHHAADEQPFEATSAEEIVDHILSTVTKR